MKKNLFILALLFMSIVVLFGCGKKEDTSNQNQSNEPKTNQPIEESPKTNQPIEESPSTNPVEPVITKEPEHVHNYGEATYTWSDDHSTCTATRICLDDETHIETETVTTVFSHTDADCEIDGKTTYTATFENEAFKTQEYTVVIEHYGHSWEDEITYTWADDYSTCTASRVCKNDPSHIETETVEATSEVIFEATEEYDGSISYEAEFTNEAFGVRYASKTIPQLPTLGKIEFVLADNGTYTVKAASSSISGPLVIPATYKDIPVTKIDDVGFQNTNITQVVIPSSVNYIGTLAFDNCTQLGEIKFVGSAESYTIALGAFKNCTKLTRLTLPSNLTVIEDEMFKGCTSLSSVFLKDNGKLETIDRDAFADCTNIDFLYLPGSIKQINDHAFGDSKKLDGLYYDGTKEDFAEIGIRPHGLPDTISTIVCTNGFIENYVVPEA